MVYNVSRLDTFAYPQTASFFPHKLWIDCDWKDTDPFLQIDEIQETERMLETLKEKWNDILKQ